MYVTPLEQYCVILSLLGRTVLVIAHRLSTIQDADTIAVVHQGKIREVHYKKYALMIMNVCTTL